MSTAAAAARGRPAAVRCLRRGRPAIKLGFRNLATAIVRDAEKRHVRVCATPKLVWTQPHRISISPCSISRVAAARRGRAGWAHGAIARAQRIPGGSPSSWATLNGARAHQRDVLGSPRSSGTTGSRGLIAGATPGAENRPEACVSTFSLQPRASRAAAGSALPRLRPDLRRPRPACPRTSRISRARGKGPTKSTPSTRCTPDRGRE